MDSLLKGLVDRYAETSHLMVLQNGEFVDQFLSEMEQIMNQSDSSSENETLSPASTLSKSTQDVHSQSPSVEQDGCSISSKQNIKIPASFQWLSCLLSNTRSRDTSYVKDADKNIIAASTGGKVMNENSNMKRLFDENVREMLISCSISDQDEVYLISKVVSCIIKDAPSSTCGDFFGVISISNSSTALLQLPVNTSRQQKTLSSSSSSKSLSAGNKRQKGSQRKQGKGSGNQPQIMFSPLDDKMLSSDENWKRYVKDEQMLLAQMLSLKSDVLLSDDSCFKMLIPEPFLINSPKFTMEMFVQLLYRLLRQGPWSVRSTTWHAQLDSVATTTHGLFLKGCVGNLIASLIVTAVLSTYECKVKENAAASISAAKKEGRIIRKIALSDYPQMFSHNASSVYKIWNSLSADDHQTIIQGLDTSKIQNESGETNTHWIKDEDIKYKTGIELLILMFGFHMNETLNRTKIEKNMKIVDMLQNALIIKSSNDMLDSYQRDASSQASSKSKNNSNSSKNNQNEQRQRPSSKSLDDSSSSSCSIAKMEIRDSSSQPRFASIDENAEVDHSLNRSNEIVEQLATGALSIPRPPKNKKSNGLNSLDRRKPRSSSKNSRQSKTDDTKPLLNGYGANDDDQDADESTIDDFTHTSNRASFSSEPILSTNSMESETKSTESDNETLNDTSSVREEKSLASSSNIEGLNKNSDRDDIYLASARMESGEIEVVPSEQNIDQSDKHESDNNEAKNKEVENQSNDIKESSDALSSSNTAVTIAASQEKATDPDQDITIRLHHDLLEMAMSLQMIADRRRPWQMAIAEKVKEAVYICFPGAWCDVFGSIASGIAAPCSDVDMVVRGVYNPQRIQILAAHLRTQEWVQNLQAIERTTVPLVRFNTAAIPISFGNRGNLIAVDISFENEAHRGLNTCILVRQLVQRYPPLKPLILIIKQFLVEKGLNDPFIGGLSSYGLVLMVTAVLQRHITPDNLLIHENGHQSENLGYLFVKFLETYSNRDFINTGVHLIDSRRQGAGKLDGSVAAIPQRPQHHHLAPLYIQDPLNPFNNVGSSCFGIMQVIQAFDDALAAIRLSIGIKPSSEWSILGRVFTTDHHQHVVKLVTQTWCPREQVNSKKESKNGTSSASMLASSSAATIARSSQLSLVQSGTDPIMMRPADMKSDDKDRHTIENVTDILAAAEWASNAHRTLSIVYHQVESGMIICPVCSVNHRIIPSPNCPLHLLVLKPAFVPVSTIL